MHDAGPGPHHELGVELGKRPHRCRHDVAQAAGAPAPRPRSWPRRPHRAPTSHLEVHRLPALGQQARARRRSSRRWSMSWPTPVHRLAGPAQGLGQHAPARGGCRPVLRGSSASTGDAQRRQARPSARADTAASTRSGLQRAPGAPCVVSSSPPRLRQPPAPGPAQLEKRSTPTSRVAGLQGADRLRSARAAATPHAAPGCGKRDGQAAVVGQR